MFGFIKANSCDRNPIVFRDGAIQSSTRRFSELLFGDVTYVVRYFARFVLKLNMESRIKVKTFMETLIYVRDVRFDII